MGSRAAESDIVPIQKAGWFELDLPSRCRDGVPLGDQIVRRQRVARRHFHRRGAGIVDATDRAGVVGRALVGDDLIQLARAFLGTVTDDNSGLAAAWQAAGWRLQN
jgi:hypothetical protein